MDFNPDNITKLTDKELLRALLLREEYLPEACRLIIKESIKRNLISSESDLQKPGFEPIILSKQHFFQFSVITSVADAQNICESIKKYFYFVSLGFGGLSAVYKIVRDPLQMWANLTFMVISIFLALMFHKFKSYSIAIAIMVLTSISAGYAVWALFSPPVFVSIPGLMLNFILFYFASEAFFATRFLKRKKSTVNSQQSAKL